MSKSIQNIIICGIGGQGVNLISSTIQKILLGEGKFCKGAMYKGGAQKRGTIYATIRIFEDEAQSQLYASQIPYGMLDVLIALETTEALRYAKYFGAETKMIVNDYNFPFYNERYQNTTVKPQSRTMLQKAYPQAYLKNYNNISKDLFQDESMVNVLATIDAIRAGTLNIDMIAFLDAIQQKTKASYEKTNLMMEYADI